MNNILRSVALAAAATLGSAMSVAPANAFDLQLTPLGGSSFTNANSGPVVIDVALSISNLDVADDLATAFSLDGGVLELMDNGLGELVPTGVVTRLLDVQPGSPFAISNLQLGSFFSGLYIVGSPIVPADPADVQTLSVPFFNFDPNVGADPFVAVPDSGVIATFRLTAEAGASAGIWDLGAYVLIGDDNGESAAATAAALTITAVPEPGTWALMAGGLALVGLGARRRRDGTTTA